MTRRFWRHAALVVLVGVSACGDSEGPNGEPAEIELLDGNGQNGGAGSPLGAPLRVLVTDADGAPLEGVAVEWEIVTGTGSVPASSTTASDGVASATFTLGPEIGEQRARAVLDGVAGSPVTFTATAAAGGGVSAIQLMSVTPVPASAPFVHDTYVRDGIVFVFAWDQGVKIYDVGNGVGGGTPAIPQQIGAVVTGTANGGTVSPSAHNGWWFHNPNTAEKRYLFVGQEGPGSVGSSASGDIHVVDVSNLAAPVEVAFYHHPDQPDDADVDQQVGVHNFWMDEPNEILYAAFYNGGVVALDVSGTLTGDLSGRVLSSIRPGGPGGTFTWGVQLADNGSLYAIDMLSGLHQLQMQGGNLVHVGGGGNVPERFSSDLWVHGSHAYTGTWGSRGPGQVGNVLKVWALSGTGAPTLVNSITIENVGTVSDVQASSDGSWLAVTAEYGSGAGLYLYSLADPASPAFIDRYLVPSPSGGLHTGTVAEVNGRQYVFAARDPSPGGPAMMIFDVTDVVP